MKILIQLAIFAAVTSLLCANAPNLLPFQGHLTDAQGAPVADGSRLVHFQIYDTPVGGRLLWVGETHRLSVNDGLVNVVLGSKTSLAKIDFSETRYLEITIDADRNEILDAADPPLLPRQLIVPGLFAHQSRNSQTLDSHDWSAILKGGKDPSVYKIDGARIADNSIQRSHLSIFPILGSDITGLQVGTENVTEQAVTQSKLAERNVVEPTLNSPEIRTTPIGQIARSLPVEGFKTSQRAPHKVVDELTIRISTTGRPVMLMLTSKPNPDDGSFYGITREDRKTPLAQISYWREETKIAEFVIQGHGDVQPGGHRSLQSCLYLDDVEPGTHTYQVRVRTELNSVQLRLEGIVLVAYEL